MRKATYLAVFEPSGDGSYSVSFPDLPGCVSWGKDFSEASKEAEDSLGLHIYGMEKDGEAVPKPSAMVVADPETATGYIICPVTVLPELVAGEIDNRKAATNCSIPVWVKEVAVERGLNCSSLLEAAILEAAHIRRPLQGVQR